MLWLKFWGMLRLVKQRAAAFPSAFQAIPAARSATQKRGQVKGLSEGRFLRVHSACPPPNLPSKSTAHFTLDSL